jgi:hypothetical protein
MRRMGMMVLALACAVEPACYRPSPTFPTADDLTGTWTGTATYPNSPFQLRLTQTGAALRGEYSDRLDRSNSVTGTFTSSAFAIVVDFGDGKLNINGTVQTPYGAQGTMFTSALGNQMFPFTMTRGID